ncbi:hypothetical protein ACFX19_027836 [Malus domestica]
MYRGSPQCLGYVHTDVDSILLYECIDYNRSANELSVDAALAILLSMDATLAILLSVDAALAILLSARELYCCEGCETLFFLRSL